jgi:hypothetical protein
VIVSSPGYEKPSNAHYWKREPWAHHSGLFAQLPEELTAPRPFSVVHRRSPALKKRDPQLKISNKRLDNIE